VGVGFLFWLPLWHYSVPGWENSKTAPRRRVTREFWYKTLARRNVLGMMLGSFGYLYVLWVYLTWLPSYLMEARGIAVLQAGIYSAIPFSIQVVVSLISGYLSDHAIKSGRSPTAVRKLFIGLGLLMGTAIVPAVLVSTTGTAVALFCIS